MALFEEFSTAYFIGQLYVEAHDGDHAVLDREQHEAANEQIYATDEPIERLDHPLVMKLDELHFPVFATEAVPVDTLALPDDYLKTSGIDNPPTLREVLVAKAERAADLLAWLTPYTVAKPDLT